uniref:Uncharacterized protein n=1 Tax=Rhizophagus irregularis (strain DAOM 181602 / DAOM 197198 / MUCL 43194) TaxID=747089 RepID=U9U639_RHIID
MKKNERINVGHHIQGRGQSTVNQHYLKALWHQGIGWQTTAIIQFAATAAKKKKADFKRQ